MRTKILFFLGAILIFGAFLRQYNLFESTSFFFDQARDALKAKEIIRGNLALVGPATDQPGVFMGPLWYYILTIFYFLTQGNPIDVLLIINFFHLGTILAFYFVGKEFFDKKTALVAALIWAVNAYAVAYSRTLSNPATTVLWTLLLIYALLKNKIIYVSFLLAVIFQLNPPSAYLLVPFIVVFYLSKNGFRNKIVEMLIASVIFLVSLSPIVMFDIKNGHGLFTSGNFKGLLFGGGGGINGYLSVVAAHFKAWVSVIGNYTFGGWGEIIFVFFSLGFFLIQKNRIRNLGLFTCWFIIPPIMFIFLYLRYESHPHYLLSLTPVAVYIVAFVIRKTFTRKKLISIALIIPFIYLNSLGLNREIINKDHLAQPGDPNKIGFGDQIQVINFLYKDSKGEPFGYYAYNLLPYWGDESWQYLFTWYGLERYRYLPTRNGGDLIYLVYEKDPYLENEIQKPWLNSFRNDYCEKGNYKIQEIKIKKMTRCEHNRL